MLLVEVILPAVVGLLLFYILGYALTDLVLPRAWSGLRLAVAPWTGYAVFVVLAQFTTQAGLDMGRTALLALVLAAEGNAVYLVSRRGTPIRRFGPATRAGGTVAALTGGVFLLGVAPILVYGYHTVIGENWDGEIYLALGEYLRSYGQSALAQAPGNPLLTILLTPPYSVRTHGFSYAHAAIGALSGLPSLTTLAPVLALLRALAVPATYFFFRTAWDWAPRPALAATATLALNPFLLWITYNTFGMQVPSFGLLPLAVAGTLLALRAAGEVGRRPKAEGRDDDTGRRPTAANSDVPTIVWTALIVAALGVTYHPALTAWAAMAGAGGLVVLGGARRRAGRVLAAGIGVGIGAALLSAVAQWISLGGFLKQYTEQTAGLGLTTFTAPTDGLGLGLSFRPLLTAGPGQALLARAGQGYGLLIALGGLVGAGMGLLWLIVEIRRRGDLWAPAGLRVATVAGGLLYLGLFFRPLDYVYGWFKAQSFVAFVLVGAVVGGAVGLTEIRGTRGWRRALLVLPVLPASALLLTLGLLLWQYHWPLRYSTEMIAARQVRAYIRPGDAVLISSSRLMPGQLFNGLLAYFLRDSRLYGTFRTANAAWNVTRPDNVYTWAVLPAREVPALYGYRPADRAWANPLLALYHAPPDLLYQQTWEQKGNYPRAAPDTPLTWQVGWDRLDGGAAPPPALAPALRLVEFGVAAFAAQTLTVGVLPAGGVPVTRTVALAPGLQQVALGVAAPATVTLLPAPGGDPPAVRWATLRTADDALPPLTAAPSISDVRMLRITSRAQGSTVETTVEQVDTYAPAQQADHVVLDVYRRGGAGGAADHFGYWSFHLAGSPATFRVPLAGQGHSPGPPAGPGAALLPDGGQRGPATDGIFTASLTFYHGATVLDTVTDIYTFSAHSAPPGAPEITDIRVRALPLLFY